MGNVNLKWCGFIVVYFCVFCVEGASLTNGNGTKPSELNGKKLIEMGMKLKLPKLRMIGKAIKNLEEKVENGIGNIENETAQILCQLNSCLPWTEWSKCSSNIHFFGSKFRTRQCSLDITICKNDSTYTKIEKEFGICGGFCPDNYNVTKNRFCLKLYSDNKRSMLAAELQCQEDGGHLINIESKTKYDDADSLVPKNFASSVWIDGKRKDVSSPWTDVYGSKKGYLKWFTGQPTNSSSELCLSVVKPFNHIRMSVDSCSSEFYSICEVGNSS